MKLFDYSVDRNNPKRFKCSMKRYNPIVTQQNTHPNSLAHVMADASTSIYRINGMWVTSSAQPIINRGLKTFGNIVPVITDPFRGFQSVNDYPLIKLKMKHHDQSGERHYIDRFVKVKGLENIKPAILANFGKGGNMYPIPTGVKFNHMEPIFKRDVAKRAFNDESLRLELGRKWKKMKLESDNAPVIVTKSAPPQEPCHALLITGVDVMSEDESKHTVEIKNSWGSKWGKDGYTNVPFDFLAWSNIWVPIFDIENRRLIRDYCFNTLCSKDKEHTDKDKDTKKDRIKHICFSLDGHYLATAYEDCVHLFELDDPLSKSLNYVNLMMPPGSSPTAVCYSDCSIVVATAATATNDSKTNVSEDGSLYMIGKDQALEWYQEKAHSFNIQRLLAAKLNGSTVLVTSSEGTTIRVWHVIPGKLNNCATKTKTRAKNNMMAVSYDGRYIAALSSCETKVKVVELKDDESSTQDLTVSLAFWLHHEDEVVTSFCFTPDLKSIITALKGGNLRVWSIPGSDAKAKDPILFETIVYEAQDFTNTRYYHHVSIAPDGNILAVAGGSLLRWISLKSRRVLKTIWLAHYGNIIDMAWAPASAPIHAGDEHGFILATLGDDGHDNRVKLWATPSDM